MEDIKNVIYDDIYNDVNGIDSNFRYSNITSLLVRRYKNYKIHVNVTMGTSNINYVAKDKEKDNTKVGRYNVRNKVAIHDVSIDQKLYHIVYYFDEAY